MALPRSAPGPRWAVLFIVASLAVGGCSSGGRVGRYGTARRHHGCGGTGCDISCFDEFVDEQFEFQQHVADLRQQCDHDLVVGWRGGRCGTGRVRGRPGAGRVRPRGGLPLAYLPHPNGDYQFVEAPPSDTRSAVSSDLQYLAVNQRTTAVAAGGFQITSLATGKQETAPYQGVQADDPHWSGDGRLLWYQDENTQYLHRVGGGTVDLKSAAGGIVDMAYTSDATGSAVFGCTFSLTSGSTPGTSPRRSPMAPRRRSPAANKGLRCRRGDRRRR